MVDFSNKKERESQTWLNKLLGKIIPHEGNIKQVAAAVSGGCDSVALLFLMQHYCRIRGLDLCVFHVDHGLRNSSAADREWVESLARRLNLRFFWRKAQVSRHQISENEGIEAWARTFRYRSFQEMLSESGASLVATGHTADDQLETLLMRIFSGSSLQGMLAIRPQTEMNTGSGGIGVWRPMLEVQRSELEQLLLKAGHDWLEDETNSSDVFLRNSVRHNLVPVVNSLFPKAAQKSAFLLKDIAQLQDYLSVQAKIFLDENACENCLKLSPMPDILHREIIRQWLIRMGFDRQITRSLIERIVELWNNKAGNRAVDHRSFKIVKKKQRLEFIKE